MGPAMRELNERERAVVYWLMDNPSPNGTQNFTEACRQAGYQGGSDALRVMGYRKRHDPRIAAALVEEGRRSIAVLGVPVATATLLSAAADRSHKDAIKASMSILGMSGISPVTVMKNETTVSHEVNLGDDVRAALELVNALRTGQMIDVTPELANPEGDALGLVGEPGRQGLTSDQPVGRLAIENHSQDADDILAELEGLL